MGIKSVLGDRWTVAVMVFYAVLLRTPAFRLRDDQSGDNLYYLGFLYTLTSIAVSLMEYTTGRDADVIVTNFGIAVFTTIAGLLLRLAFNQMRGDTADVERVTRMELAEAARRMRTELDNAVLELKQFQRATLQSVEGSFTTMRELTEETLKTLSHQRRRVQQGLDVHDKGKRQPTHRDHRKAQQSNDGSGKFI